MHAVLHSNFKCTILHSKTRKPDAAPTMASPLAA